MSGYIHVDGGDLYLYLLIDKIYFFSFYMTLVCLLNVSLISVGDFAGVLGLV